MTREELRAGMHPDDIAAAQKLAAEAPPFTPRQQSALLAIWRNRRPSATSKAA